MSGLRVLLHIFIMGHSISAGVVKRPVIVILFLVPAKIRAYFVVMYGHKRRDISVACTAFSFTCVLVERDISDVKPAVGLTLVCREK